MFIFMLIISIVITLLGYILIRRDSIFSPAKLLIIINGLYLLIPVILYCGFQYHIEDMGELYPPLYDKKTSVQMLYLYNFFLLNILFFRLVVFKRLGYKTINNLAPYQEDVHFYRMSVLFIIIGSLFLLLAMAMVGINEYMTYTIEATIGGNVVAQSFKSEGEFLIGIFSLPLLKYLYYKKNYIVLAGFICFFIGISLIGGARKFLVFPFLYFLLIYTYKRKINFARVIPFALYCIAIALVLSIIQGVRGHMTDVISIDLMVSTITYHLGFAYLVPASFVYYNFDVLNYLDFSTITYVKQLLAPILLVVPRFIYPNKDELIPQYNSDVLSKDFPTVGGSSFIEYFLSNSFISILLFYPILICLIFYLFKCNQKIKSSLRLMIYISSVIVLIWFSFSMGYIMPLKAFIMQILVSIIIYYYLTIFVYSSVSKKKY